MNPPEEFKQSFLTHDRELHTIVRIDVGFRSEISAYGIGKIDGDHLDTVESGASFEKFYGRYRDPEGRSIFDRNKIRHRPDQDWKSYQLEKYDPR